MKLELPLQDNSGNELNDINMSLCCEKVKIITDQMSIGFDIEADFTNSKLKIDKKTQVFLMIRKWNPESEDETQFDWHPVFKSEIKSFKKNTLIIEWNRFLKSSDNLAKSDDTPILVTAYRYDKHGQHQEIKRWNFKLEDIKSLQTRDVPVQNSEHIRKLRDFEKDGLSLKDIEIKNRESFIDFVMGGCEIGLQVAVDFTASNDNVTPSLH